MKRLSICLTIGLCVPFAIALPTWAQSIVTNPALSAASAASTAGIAAQVNGEPILLDDLNRMVDSIKAQEPSFNTNTPAAIKALSDIKIQVLDNMITTKVLSQEARRQKIVADPKAVDDALTNIKSGFKTDAEFRTALQKDNKTSDDLRRVIADELAIRELSKRLSSDVTVSGDDIATYYRANLDQFKIPAGIKARHILLAVNPNSPPEEKERVRKRALDLIKQLNNKADFIALAKANSDDQSNKDRGGDLGAFTRGQMVKPFEDAAFAAPVGKIVGPVVTDFGFHIIRVDEIIPEKTLTLAEVQNDPQIGPILKAQLLKQKVQKRLDDNIDRLKKASKITKNV